MQCYIVFPSLHIQPLSKDNWNDDIRRLHVPNGQRRAHNKPLCSSWLTSTSTTLITPKEGKRTSNPPVEQRCIEAVHPSHHDPTSGITGLNATGNRTMTRTPTLSRCVNVHLVNIALICICISTDAKSMFAVNTGRGNPP